MFELFAAPEGRPSDLAPTVGRSPFQAAKILNLSVFRSRGLAAPGYERLPLRGCKSGMIAKLRVSALRLAMPGPCRRVSNPWVKRCKGEGGIPTGDQRSCLAVQSGSSRSDESSREKPKRSREFRQSYHITRFFILIYAFMRAPARSGSISSDKTTRNRGRTPKQKLQPFPAGGWTLLTPSRRISAWAAFALMYLTSRSWSFISVWSRFIVHQNFVVKSLQDRADDDGLTESVVVGFNLAGRHSRPGDESALERQTKRIAGDDRTNPPRPAAFPIGPHR